MNNWHSAKTGRMPTPSPLQAQALAHVHEAQTHGAAAASFDSQMAAMPAPSAAAHHPSDSGSNPGTTMMPFGVTATAASSTAHNDWSSVPWGLTQALHGVIASDSELRANVQKLKSASEELRREQKYFTTHAVVQTMTAGTTAIGKDLSGFKSSTLAHQSATDLRVHELESLVSRLSTELATLKRQVDSQSDSTRVGLESVDSRLGATSRDIQERGLIMSQLGDRLMDEIDSQRTRGEEIQARLKEMERRVFLWEYSTALTNATAQQQKQQEMIQTALVPSSAGSVTVVGSKANSLSNAASIAARKQQHFVTKDSVQPRPPGTAIFNAVALQQQQQQQQQHNGHPLAGVIEQHRAEKAGEMDVQARVDKDLAESAAAATASAGAATAAAGASAGASSSTPGSRQTSSGREHVAALVVPSVLSSTVNSPVQSARSITHVSSHVNAAPAQLVAAYSHGSPPSPPVAAASTVPAPPGSPNSTQYQRYMADYTTRSLQRDLLEIAETYQATIRNEVDGLRSQLLQIRRQHSEEMAKIQMDLSTSSNQLSSHASEQKRSLSVFDFFLRGRIDELVERMSTVEKRTGQIEALSVTRSTQMELKYSQRNEEVIKELRNLYGKIQEGFGGKLTTTGGGGGGGESESSGAGKSNGKANNKLLSSLERDLRTLSLNLEQSSLVSRDRTHALNSDLVRLRESTEEGLRTMRNQLIDMNQQMKSLFAEAFAGVILSNGERILPLLTPSIPGVGSSGSGGGGSHSRDGQAFGEKARFVMSPRKMNVVSRGSTPRSVNQPPPTTAGGSNEPIPPSEEEQQRPRTQDSVQVRSGTAGSMGRNLWSNDAGYFQPAPAASIVGSEEKQPSPPSPQLSAQTARGYGTTGQVRRRPIAVSGLSRGHGSSVASTPGSEIRRTDSRSPERPVVIEQLLSLGRKGLASRPSTTQQQRAVRSANATQDEQMTGTATSASHSVSQPLQQQQRPRTTEVGGRSAIRTPLTSLASTQPLDQ